jgi:hypothetical protein
MPYVGCEDEETMSSGACLGEEGRVEGVFACNSDCSCRDATVSGLPDVPKAGLAEEGLSDLSDRADLSKPLIREDLGRPALQEGPANPALREGLERPVLPEDLARLAYREFPVSPVVLGILGLPVILQVFRIW